MNTKKLARTFLNILLEGTGNSNWNTVVKYVLDNSEMRLRKGELMNMAYSERDREGNIESAIPASLWDEVDSPSFFVMDYTGDSAFGELVDLREKLQSSNEKVRLAFIRNKELFSGKTLPPNLQNLTFYEAANFIYDNRSEISNFTITPN